MRSISIISIIICVLIFLSPLNVFSAEISNSQTSKIIESTILWEAQIDEVTWEPLKLNELLKDTKLFSKVGNFYKVNYDLNVFGHKALYVGTRGVELIVGPNVTLAGKTDSISESISKNYNIEFKNHGEIYVAELKDLIELVITPHPNMKDTSLVIGAYTGE